MSIDFGKKYQFVAESISEGGIMPDVQVIGCSDGIKYERYRTTAVVPAKKIENALPLLSTNFLSFSWSLKQIWR